MTTHSTDPAAPREAVRAALFAAAVAGLAVLLGGAVGNLLDRSLDGVVTDYLHTGWWPTFNLADVAILTGAGLLLLGTLRQPPSTGRDEAL